MGKAGDGYIYAGGDYQRTYPMTGVLRWRPEDGNLQIFYNGWQSISTGGGGGGTFDYEVLTNKPSINNITLVGNVEINAESVGALPDSIVVPTLTSQLYNDSGFITNAPVLNVNGQTGEVVIAVPTKTSELINDTGFININTVPVKSVNGKTGVVNLVIPTKTSELENDSGFVSGDNFPVQSVNGMTGQVFLSASDVGALSNATIIPSRTSQLTNDSGYITSAPVTSVNGKTGSVLIEIPTDISELTDNNQLYAAKVHTHIITDITDLQATLNTFAIKSDTYTKAEVDNRISSIYRPKGSVADYDSLPTTGNVVGDTYTVLDTGAEYTYTVDGKWEYMGEKIDLTPYAKIADLATVATTGSYNDLLNQPTIPTKTSQLTNDSNFATVSQIPVVNYPVTSVNNKTGAVTLSAGDVGALPNTTVIPTKTSQLTNDSDFTTKAYVDGLIGDINTVLDEINGEVI